MHRWRPFNRDALTNCPCLRLCRRSQHVSASFPFKAPREKTISTSQRSSEMFSFLQCTCTFRGATFPSSHSAMLDFFPWCTRCGWTADFMLPRTAMQCKPGYHPPPPRPHHALQKNTAAWAGVVWIWTVPLDLTRFVDFIKSVGAAIILHQERVTLLWNEFPQVEVKNTFYLITVSQCWVHCKL